MDWLLSDEFVIFSQKIAEIHAQKKKLKQELQDLYKEIQSKIKGLDDEAVALQAEFEQWKTDQEAEKIRKQRSNF